MEYCRGVHDVYVSKWDVSGHVDRLVCSTAKRDMFTDPVYWWWLVVSILCYATVTRAVQLLHRIASHCVLGVFMLVHILFLPRKQGAPCRCVWSKCSCGRDCYLLHALLSCSTSLAVLTFLWFMCQCTIVWVAGNMHAESLF